MLASKVRENVHVCTGAGVHTPRSPEGGFELAHGGGPERARTRDLAVHVNTDPKARLSVRSNVHLAVGQAVGKAVGQAVGKAVGHAMDVHVRLTPAGRPA